MVSFVPIHLQEIRFLIRRFPKFLPVYLVKVAYRVLWVGLRSGRRCGENAVVFRQRHRPMISYSYKWLPVL